MRGSLREIERELREIERVLREIECEFERL